MLNPNMKVAVQILLILFMILLGFISRVGWLIPNWALVGALALWAPYVLGNLALSGLVVYSSLLLSDWVLGFYPEQMWVYMAYLPYLLIGSKFKGFHILKPLLGSFGFFVISNFGVWVSTDFYPHNLDGLINCFVMAIPFYKNTLFSDLSYFYLAGIMIHLVKNTQLWSYVTPTNSKG
jgi:hypothetical protein